MRLSLSVLTAFAFLVGCGGGDTTTVINDRESSTVTVTTDSGKPTAPPAQGSDQGGGAFQTPSGNISCFVDANFVNCSIYEASWQPGDNPNCPTSAGRSVSLDSDGVRPRVFCGTPEPAVGPVLPYGDSTSRGSYSCSSASDGVTCEGQGRGFFLSRERVTTH